LDKVFIQENKLPYAGYDVERSFDSITQRSFATIKKNGETLVHLDHGFFLKDSTKIGLFSLLGKDAKQIIIGQYSGDAHCCWMYKIYELTKKINLIFDGEEYHSSNIGIVDIDGDRKYEHVLDSYFILDDLSNAESVRPEFVLFYNENEGKYILEKDKFTNYLLRNIEEYIQEYEAISMKISINDSNVYREYLSAILKIIITYIYAGKDREGWEFYNKRYRYANKNVIRSEIVTNLKEDPIYKAIYNKGATGMETSAVGTGSVSTRALSGMRLRTYQRLSGNPAATSCPYQAASLR
jgi:hypothetical protein